MQRRSRTIAGAALCLLLGLSLQGCSEQVKAHIKKGAQEVWNTAIQGACSTEVDAIVNPLRMTYLETTVTNAACTMTDTATKATCITQFTSQLDTTATTKKTEFKSECSRIVGNCSGQDWGLTKLKTCVDTYKAANKDQIYNGMKASYDKIKSEFSYSAKSVRLFEVDQDGGIISGATPVLFASVAAASAILAVALYVRAQRASRDVQVTSAQDGDEELLEDGLE